MKVVHLCNLPLAPDHPDHARVPTHPGRWVLNLALAQRRHTEIRPELVVQVPGTRANHTTRIEGIPIHYLAAPARLRASTLFWFDVRRIAHYATSLQPDLVHAHGTEDAYGLAAQKTKRPCVLTAQGLHFLINPILRPPLFARERITELTERICLRRARHVITKSDYVRAALVARFPHLVTHLIPNTYDARLEAKVEPRAPHTAIFVAVIHPRKGLHDLRAAAGALRDRLPSFRLWIVGNSDSPRTEYEATETRALRQILGDRVRFWGTLSAEKTASLIARAGVLVAPSLEEMFGNQVVEALLLGTPVVVTEETAMAENVRRFGNGRIIPKGDPVALADAVETTLQSPPSLEVVARAKQAIHDWMNPEHIARLHREVYERVLAGSELGDFMRQGEIFTREAGRCNREAG